MAIRRCVPLAAWAFLISAVATIFYTVFPVFVNPCPHSLSRLLLAGSGVISCAAGDGSTSPLSDGSGDKKIGGPIVTDLRTCGEAKLPAHSLPPLPFYCCPPRPNSEPINFTLPDPAEPLRIRRPVHAVGAEHIAKYERAIALMKALPRTDPRSFYQLANVHCAYCTGSYRQRENPELNVQIHFSWFFFAFHRAHMYFFERIAAKLLGEPGFAVPFWSWDVPEGMRMPPEFANTSSPLYDPVRNLMHSPPRLVDLDYANVEKNLTDEQQILYNLRVMYKQMISNAALPSLFHGQPFRAGQPDKPGPGTVEVFPHNTMHKWTGDIRNPNAENMGTYYSAGRDPLFYPHHNNIDRLWEAWRDVGAARGYHGHVDFTDPDWLNSSFLFYDEEARLVRITVRDVLDTEKLRYKYHGVGMPWLDAPPPITPNVNNKKGSHKSIRFPVSLDAVLTANVVRPQVRRSQEQEEVLAIDGIETDGTDMVKFDVYVNAMEHEKVEPMGREMAGSYVCLNSPSMDGTEKGMRIKTSMRVALSELLEDLGADGDESLTVTLVPRHGNVKIGSLKIVYMVE